MVSHTGNVIAYHAMARVVRDHPGVILRHAFGMFHEETEQGVEGGHRLVALFGDEVLYHLEFQHFGGRVTCSALPIVRYTTEERLNEIIALHEQNGVFIANPHVYTLEDGSRHKKADADQLGFKHAVDPMGLLNPGKMRTFKPR